MVANLNFLDPKGVALISWTVTIVALTRTRTDGRGRHGGHFRDRPCRGAIRRRHVPAELQLLERHLRDVR